MSVDDVLSMQLYSLRDVGDLPAQLAVSRQAGYGHVELIGGHLADPEATRKALAAEGLKASSTHVSMDVLSNDIDTAIGACQLLEISHAFMPAVPDRDRRDRAYWHGIGVELGRAAERFAGEGIVLGFHNHDWDFAEVAPGETAMDVMFAGAGSSPLAWEADVAWIARGGVNVEDALNKYANRLVAAHVKDTAPEGQNLDQDGWSDVGAGTLDWKSLWPLCRRLGAEWMVVEHDKPADPAGFAAASRAFLQANVS
ncbi:MAG: sugar phosphate isomerase/epimerase [Pseudomonadota bacterium]